MLLEAMAKGTAGYAVDDFYYLARAALVKDERYFDTYDKVFANFFQGAMNATGRIFESDIPADWLKRLAERTFDEDEIEKLEAMGFREMMDELAKRLAEQRRAHHGGDRWIGTGGTSPFGNAGRNPAGVRIGGEGGGGRATKVWEKRAFRGLDGTLEIGTRNFKLALRKLRQFAREGAEDEFDLNGTIRATADNGGYLDIRMRPERRNRIKVLLFIDVGGTMDSHVRISEELFSAARSELKHLEYFYFHNFLYERVWRKHRRGYDEWVPTWEVLNAFGPDYKVILVGDATMSPYEITEAGGSIEHWNEEPGEVWLRRLRRQFADTVWLNPVPVGRWMTTPSVRITHQLMDGGMFPLTLEGLDAAVKLLRRGGANAASQLRTQPPST